MVSDSEILTGLLSLQYFMNSLKGQKRIALQLKCG